MKKNIARLFVLALSILSLISLIGLASSTLQLLCLTENQTVRFSLCNPAMPDYSCLVSSCQICVDYSNSIYCPESLNACNQIPQCTPLGNQTNQTIPSFNVTLVSPINGYSINTTTNVSLAFKYNVTSYRNISYCNLLINNVAVAQNTTPIKSTINNISRTLFPGQYLWTIACADKSGETALAQARLLNVTLNVLPNILPNVTLVSPENNYTTSLSSISFQYNVSSSVNITNCNLYMNGIFSSTNSSKILTGLNNITKSLIPGNYTWLVSCNHKSGSTISSLSRFLTILSNSTNQTQIILPNVTLISPINNYAVNLTNSTNATVLFSYNLTSAANITSCSLYLNNILADSNTSKINSSINSISKTLFPGQYNWGVSCLHINGNSTTSEQRAFNIYPSQSNNQTNQTSHIVLVSPDNNAKIETNDPVNVSFVFAFNNTNSSNIKQCSLLINDAAVLNQTAIKDNNTITSLLPLGSYNWNISCVDSSFSLLNSELRGLTIEQPASQPPSGGGGGGGGGGSSIPAGNLTNSTNQTSTNSANTSQTGLNNSSNSTTQLTNSGISRITGAVVGVLGTGGSIAVIAGIVLIAGTAIWMNKRKKAKAEDK